MIRLQNIWSSLFHANPPPSSKHLPPLIKAKIWKRIYPNLRHSTKQKKWRGGWIPGSLATHSFRGDTEVVRTQNFKGPAASAFRIFDFQNMSKF